MISLSVVLCVSVLPRVTLWGQTVACGQSECSSVRVSVLPRVTLWGQTVTCDQSECSSMRVSVAAGHSMEADGGL